MLSEEQFRCSICLDIFNKPVSIPCGHNFCMGCINRFWDTRHKSECPLCKEAFRKRPELRINVGLRDITEHFKRSIIGQPTYKPAPAKRSILRQPSIERDHRHHEIVPIEKESMLVRTKLKEAEADFQHMVNTRVKKLEEVIASVESRKMNEEQALHTSIQVANMVSGIIEKNQASLIQEIQQKREASEGIEKELIKELKGEINELQRRRSELQHLENSGDPLHLLQSFPSLNSPLSTRDWTKVRVNSNSYIGTVRRAFSKLVDVCHTLEKKLSAEEMSKASQYAVDVTLDPVTASGWLCLSPDRKQVSLSLQQKKPSPPDDPRRFDSCVSILGKESFTSGRHYWVVQVGNKTDWDLGVAKESINRKGAITVAIKVS
ncbi:hypothetical protein PFLUV_G00167940 [Perca fluviatilis]|uniref:RING-type domain-containing protein n=1 Tax=Perca fluviatilis TaxID=8168 RepID=A0A6A5DYA1_PERFL|nr:hypothetical protein PFLUV_G00167940 [Perca fluviatilis]